MNARAASFLAVFVGLSIGIAAPAASAEEAEISRDDFRVYCGYLDALENPKVKKLKGKRRDQKIAKMAKMKVRDLQKAVKHGEAHGATCDEVGKKFEAAAKTAVDKALPGRVDLFILDYSDPSHVVASVRWVGGDMKKLVAEGTKLAHAIRQAAPIARTIAVRGVNPAAKDRKSDAAIWFEARMSADRAKNIDEKRIENEANSRYIRLFDGVKCGKQPAHPTQLGGARGPCKGKSI